MTAYRMVNLYCDGDDACPAALEDGTNATVSEARRIARREGWTHRNGKDYCPEHPPTKGATK